MSSEPAAGPPQPGRASATNAISVLYTAISEREARACFLLPLASFVLILIVSRALAPGFGGDSASAYSSYFSTAAQVCATVLIALALELRAQPLRELNARRLIVAVTLVYVALGVAAGAIALNPGLAPTLYKWLFALTTAAGAAAVISVLTIAYRVLENEASSRRDEARG